MADQTKYTAKLKDAKILVIGGSAGIGYAVAEAAVEHGAIVTISSSNTSRVESTVATLKKVYPSATSRVAGYACDLSSADTAERNIGALLEKTGTLDHIVYTAGDALAMTKLEDLTMENMRQAGQVRFFAPLLLAKHAPRYLAGGPKSSIIFTGGAAAERPAPGWSLISGYASGLHGVVRGLALDLKPIRVNLVQPGITDTNLLTTSGVPDAAKQDLFAEMSKKLPVGKVAAVEDMAESYMYLMRDENVTGEIINSNGGQLLV